MEPSFKTSQYLNLTNENREVILTSIKEALHRIRTHSDNFMIDNSVPKNPLDMRVEDELETSLKILHGLTYILEEPKQIVLPELYIAIGKKWALLECIFLNQYGEKICITSPQEFDAATAEHNKRQSL